MKTLEKIKELRTIRRRIQKFRINYRTGCNVNQMENSIDNIIEELNKFVIRDNGD